jgi:hypothetical protein
MSAAIPTAFAPTQTPPSPSLPLPPSPSDMPQLWDSIKVGSPLGTLQFGPVFGDEGRVIVDLDSAIKTDKQKSSGKSKSKTKVNGKEDIKGKLIVKWTGKSWANGCRFTMQLDPQGPNGGAPLTVDHPEFQRRTGAPTLGQNATAQPIKIIIKKAGKLTITAGEGIYSQEVEFEEWVPPDDTPGTTDTPSRANGYGFNGSATSFGGSGVNPNGLHGPPSAWTDTAVAPKATP